MGLLRVNRATTPALGRQIEAVHIQERLRKGLGTTGGDPVSALSDEVVPVILVDDLTKRDLSNQGRMKRYIACLDTGVPVNESFVFVCNQDPRVKVIVEGVSLHATTTTKLIWMARATGVQGTNTGSRVFFPFNQEGGPGLQVVSPGVAVFNVGDQVGTLSSNGAFGIPLGAQGMVFFPLMQTLGFNDQLQFSSAVAANATQIALLVSEVDPNP